MTNDDTITLTRLQPVIRQGVTLGGDTEVFLAELRCGGSSLRAMGWTEAEAKTRWLSQFSDDPRTFAVRAPAALLATADGTRRLADRLRQDLGDVTLPTRLTVRDVGDGNIEMRFET